jgi:hypothetical protein
MSGTKFTLIAAAAAIAFASPAFAKTIRHSQENTQQLYDYSVAAPPAGASLDNPYYAPYEGGYSGGSFPVGGFH